MKEPIFTPEEFRAAAWKIVLGLMVACAFFGSVGTFLILWATGHIK